MHVHRTILHHTTSHHTTPYHTTSHHITSHHITWHHITSQHTTLHHITSHHITRHHITSDHSTPHHSTSHHITSHHITPHHITLHDITSDYTTRHHIWLHDTTSQYSHHTTYSMYHVCAALINQYVFIHTWQGLMKEFSESKRKLHWRFISTLERPRVVHAMVSYLENKENLFAQVTVRLHINQVSYLALTSKYADQCRAVCGLRSQSMMDPCKISLVPRAISRVAKKYWLWARDWCKIDNFHGVARLIFERGWRTPLKVNIRFKVNKVTKHTVSGCLTLLCCWSWLACTDKATLSAIVYFEWSPPTAAHQFLWKMMRAQHLETLLLMIVEI